MRYVVLTVFALAACTRTHGPTTPKIARLPTPSVQVGACGDPGRDGVVGTTPRIDRADRDLDGDGRPEVVVVDRAMCTSDGNCYWNVFRAGRDPGECSRYAGTFQAAALEPMSARGDDNMADVRGYWNLHGGRMLLQEYRFVRDGYQIVATLLCRRATDDKLDCADQN